MKIKISKLLKFTVSILTIVLFSGFINSVSNVVICEGKYSKKYHYSKSCRGLSNCKASIVKVTLTEVKKIGRTLCGWED
jgi:hypothetical protein